MILITSPHPSFTSIIMKVSTIRNLNIKVVESILEDSVEEVQNIQKNHPNEEIEVIVSRGGTAETLKKHFKFPIVNADVTDFDVLKAFWEAKSFSCNIGYLGYQDDQKQYDFPLISQILGVEIKMFPYKNTSEIKTQLQKIKEEAIDVTVVGSHLAEVEAQKMGLKIVLVYSSSRAIDDAISHAQEILYALKQEKFISHKLKTVMDLSGEGIVTVDNDGTISYVNLAAESILRLEKGDLIGRNIKDSVFQTLMNDSIDFKKPTVGRIEEINSIKLIINCLPLILNEERRGMVINFSNIKNIQQMEQKIRTELHKQGFTAKYTFTDIIGRSSSLMQTVKVAKQFGISEHTIIINGETGTGKERFAHSIHNISRRKDNPFVAVNCGAFPENLLDSELFGYVEGAFTGALKSGKIGLIEVAHRGTLFLDEIDKMPMNLQVKILRVLQERQIRPIGGNKIVPVDVRIIAATNRNLMERIKKNEFLVDLYFRLNVLNFTIPPLRERKDDIFLLINLFCQNYRPSVSLDIFTPDMKEHFLWYDWPGNVRELENLTNRYITLHTSRVDDNKVIDYFPEFQRVSQQNPYFKKADASEGIYIKPGLYKDMERQLVLQLIDRFQGNKSMLANFLGISRNTIAKILKEQS